MAYGNKGTLRIFPPLVPPKLDFPLLENESVNALLEKPLVVRRHGYIARLTANTISKLPVLKNNRLYVAL